MAQVKALLFDVFGTLTDWRTSIAREAKELDQPVGDKVNLAEMSQRLGELETKVEKILQLLSKENR